MDNIIYSQHINFCSVLVQHQPWKYQTNPLVAVFVALYLLPVEICCQKGGKTRELCTVYHVIYIPLITLSSNVTYGFHFKLTRKLVTSKVYLPGQTTSALVDNSSNEKLVYLHFRLSKNWIRKRRLRQELEKMREKYGINKDK